MQVLAATVAAMPVPWRRATRVAFRFGFLYFGLYVLLTRMISGLLRLPVGSGDKVFDWVQVFVLLVASLAGTAVWSRCARREEYERLHGGFQIVLRFALGATMIGYGMSKAIPRQMPPPALTQLLEPFGNFSPMGVLWSSIGASPAYERFAGCAELIAGVLLFVPSLSTLGALVSLADATEIFALNMTYDVPVKLLSFHLILMSLWLLAPDVKRLANVLVLNRAAAPKKDSLWRTPRSARLAVTAQWAFGVYLFLTSLGFGLCAQERSPAWRRSILLHPMKSPVEKQELLFVEQPQAHAHVVVVHVAVERQELAARPGIRKPGARSIDDVCGEDVKSPAVRRYAPSPALPIHEQRFSGSVY